MQPQTPNQEPLRKCKYCGLTATTKTELEMFKKSKESKHGREQVCKCCQSEVIEKRLHPNRKSLPHTTWLRKCTYCGLEANTIEELKEFKIDERSNYGRQNVCYKCSNQQFSTPWFQEHGRKRKTNNYDEDPVKYHCRIAAKKYPLKSKCEKCGSTEKLERHHPDHSKPEEFQTLCHKCHNALRRKPITF